MRPYAGGREPGGTGWIGSAWTVDTDGLCSWAAAVQALGRVRDDRTVGYLAGSVRGFSKLLLVTLGGVCAPIS